MGYTLYTGWDTVICIVQTSWSSTSRIVISSVLHEICCSSFVATYFANKNLASRGLLTYIEYITFFSCPNKRNIFCERSISIKKTLTRNNWENGMLKVSPTEYCYIYNKDWLWAPFFSIISSQSCFIEMNLSEKNNFWNWKNKHL